MPGTASAETRVAIGMLLPGGGVTAAALVLADVDETGPRLALKASIGDLAVLQDLDAALTVAVLVPTWFTRDVLGAPAAMVVQGTARVGLDQPGAEGPGGLRGWLLRDHRDHPVRVEVIGSRILSWSQHDSPAPADVLVGSRDVDHRPRAGGPVDHARLQAQVRPTAYAEALSRADQHALTWTGMDDNVHLRQVSCSLDEEGGLLVRGAGLPGDSCPAAIVAHGARGRASSQVRLQGWFDGGRSLFSPATATAETLLPMTWARDLAIGLAARRGLRAARASGLLAKWS